MRNNVSVSFSSSIWNQKMKSVRKNRRFLIETFLAIFNLCDFDLIFINYNDLHVSSENRLSWGTWGKTVSFFEECRFDLSLTLPWNVREISDVLFSMTHLLMRSNRKPLNLPFKKSTKKTIILAHPPPPKNTSIYFCILNFNYFCHVNAFLSF